MSVDVRTRTIDAPHLLRGFRPFSWVMRSIVDALGGANPRKQEAEGLTPELIAVLAKVLGSRNGSVTRPLIRDGAISLSP
jgi:hypothetical protein